MGGDRGRDEADVPGGGRDPGRDQHGVQTAPDPVGAVVGLEAVVGLQGQPVLDGDEVEQAALGLADQVGPVAGGEQLAAGGRRARATRPDASRRRRGRPPGASGPG